MVKNRIAVISDLHCPYQDHKKVTKCLEYIKDFKPDHIIFIGDIYDQFAFSRFPKDYHTKSLSAVEEIATAFEYIRSMVIRLKKENSQAKIKILRGNHDVRLEKRISEKMHELIGIFNLNQFWEFPGIETIIDVRQEVIINDILFTHGHRSKIGDHSRYYLRNVVCGHLHRPGIVYFPYKDKTLWELNVGFLGDPSTCAFSYTTTKITNWTNAFGVIDEDGPRVILV